MDEDEAVAVEEEGFEGFPVFCDEDEEGPGEEVGLRLFQDDVGEGVVPLPHVDVFVVEEYGVAGVENHGGNHKARRGQPARTGQTTNLRLD